MYKNSYKQDYIQFFTIIIDGILGVLLGITIIIKPWGGGVFVNVISDLSFVGESFLPLTQLLSEEVEWGAICYLWFTTLPHFVTVCTSHPHLMYIVTDIKVFLWPWFAHAWKWNIYIGGGLGGGWGWEAEVL